MSGSVHVGAAQFAPGPDVEANLRAMRELAEAAVARGCELLVFPEESMLEADDELSPPLPEQAAEAWPRFEAAIAEMAVETGMAIVAAGYAPDDGARVANRLIAVGPDGTRLASYDKLHLYDAFSYRESDYARGGSDLPGQFELGGLRFGLANCYDLRFPELFRWHLDHGADVLLVAAAWVRGEAKERHWATLLEARAIENVAWVVASATVGPDTAGLSRIIEPGGELVSGLPGHGNGVADAVISRSSLDEARCRLPALNNRRIDITYSAKEAT